MKLLLVLLALRWAEGHYTFIHDPATLHVLFGDLGDMSDLRLPPPGQKPPFEQFDDTDDDDEAPDLKTLFKPIDDLREANRTITNDINDFNTVTKRLAAIKIEFHNASYIKKMEELHARRAYSKKDWEEPYGFYFNYESTKIQKLRRLALGFLIHTRFKCDFAIRQRRCICPILSYLRAVVIQRFRSDVIFSVSKTTLSPFSSGR